VAVHLDEGDDPSGEVVDRLELATAKRSVFENGKEQFELFSQLGTDGVKCSCTWR
jgi:hypothetical protein